jgi:putative hemolysin
VLLLCLGVSACGQGVTSGPTSTPTTGIANPASVYCEEHGGVLELVEEEGGQVGHCVFPDGSRCEEWAFHRDECSPRR